MYGVAFVLAFIGLKLLGSFAGVEVPTEVSLAVVVASIGAGVGASLLLPPPDDDSGGGSSGE
ncbi:hypothetical protein EMIHUDRAFT_373794 [Emiliania huxleyi CCMP1516]|uniref:Uncharacterized protein n=2 Tax=Emiliania huxleyi TaxID=2903 RepID=A0A0D3JRD8_EMIH1|nr:hypothetical protein EMIHUDRAFT_373794 [Emiliania huxleyi CCMP1516]EOD26073.1 hypothetical protein EMIHUDRAFT_373794 [Emiliania huxleyi CCMP1516]|eukprot:XP_005778502.1 hypothetical protein EMIHUDRAFT_373794 [Emiliania huxleyi CCMP1516]